VAVVYAMNVGQSGAERGTTITTARDADEQQGLHFVRRRADRHRAVAEDVEFTLGGIPFDLRKDLPGLSAVS